MGRVRARMASGHDGVRDRWPSRDRYAARLHTLSLSVERANPAVGLYLSEGWQVVKAGRDSDTMVLELAS